MSNFTREEDGLDPREDLVTNLVPFGLSLLAKEKGFDYITLEVFDKATGCINMHWDEAYLSDNWHEEYLSMEDFIPAPTQGILKMWLKEVHNIDVWAQPFIIMQKIEGSDVPIHGKLDGTYSYFVFKDNEWVMDATDYETEHEALNEGLETALKHV